MTLGIVHSYLRGKGGMTPLGREIYGMYGEGGWLEECEAGREGLNMKKVGENRVGRRHFIHIVNAICALFKYILSRDS